MKNSSIDHIANTWLVANVIQFVLISLSVVIWFPFEEASLLFIIASVAGIVFSVPALVAAYFCFDLIADASLPVNTRFLIWLVVCPTIVLLECGIGLMIFGKGDLTGIFFCIPGLLAAFFAILIRYKAFVNLASRSQHIQVL
jgi:hypothetical protein